VLTGAHPAQDDPDFQAYVDRTILADFHQAIGRLRSHRRSGEQLRVIIISNFDLDLPVQRLKASDVTQDAATKVERIEMAIRGAVQQLQAEGQKLTQQAIAALTGCSQQYISRFRVLLQTLIENSISKSGKTGEPPPDPLLNLEELDWTSREYLPLLALESPDEILKGVSTTFEVYGQTIWKRIWDTAPGATQIKILQTAFASILTVKELQNLYCTEET
jgi:hypothetical protein